MTVGFNAAPPCTGSHCEPCNHLAQARTMSDDISLRHSPFSSPHPHPQDRNIHAPTPTRTPNDTRIHTHTPQTHTYRHTHANTHILAYIEPKSKLNAYGQRENVGVFAYVDALVFATKAASGKTTLPRFPTALHIHFAEPRPMFPYTVSYHSSKGIEKHSIG